MKKIFLILTILFAYSLSAQTLQNPTYGNTTTNTLKIKTPATVTSVNFLPAFDADGFTVSKIAPVNINIPYTPTNYSISNQSIGQHLTGIDTRLGQISSTTAGITQRVYFTADNTTVTAGTFFATSLTGKGSTATGSPSALVLADNTKGYFNKDLISIAQPANTIGYAGTYSGQLTVSASPTPVATQQRFTVEIYRTDNGGTPITSGVSGAPTGDLGVTVVAILDSGILNLTAGSITNIPVTGILTQNITLNTGERLRYHVSAAKIGAGGGNVTFGVYYGSSYNSYYDVPVAITTDAVLNKSTVTPAITSSDALNSLNSTKDEILNNKFKNIPFSASCMVLIGDSFSEGVGAANYEGSFANKLIYSILNSSDKGFLKNRGYGYPIVVNTANFLTDVNISTTGSVVTGGVTDSRLRLNVGQTLTIANRNINYLDVFYDASLSSGNLEVRLNGVLVQTKTLSGTGIKNTFTSSFSVQTTKATDIITLTATGTAYITGVESLRESQKTPVVFNVAKSGNTFNDFNTSPFLDEIGAYANFGGSQKYIAIALGTNSIYNASKAQTPTAYIASLTSLISGINARVAGVRYIITVPAKSNESIFPIISPGFTYQDYVSAVVNFCRTNDYGIVRYDQTQLGTGSSNYLADGVHPNDLGHEILASKWSETLGINTDNRNTSDGVGLFVSGAGSANSISKWNSPYSQTNSLLYDNGASIGVGTSSQGSAPNNMLFGFVNGSNIQARTLSGHPQIAISSNVNGDWYSPTYSLNKPANQIILDPDNGGDITFRYAPSGTAGNPITWTSQMVLRSNGNVLVKTATDNGVDVLQVNGTASASPATLSNQLVTKAQLDAVSPSGVKRYKALISQTGTSAPTVIVLENSLGITPVWTRTATGIYEGSMAGITPDKTLKLISGELSDDYSFGISMGTLGGNHATVTTRSAGVNMDGLLNKTSIYFEVYP